MTTSMSVIKWADIELLHNLVKSIDHQYENGLTKPLIRYRAKVKLDGTNAGVQVHPDLSVHAQSRSRIITLDDDNHGFAAWVAKNAEYFQKSYQMIRVREDAPITVTYHGEWCGQGIQKRTAISRIDKKVFALFAIQREIHTLARTNELLINPADISVRLPHSRDDVPVIPWCGRDIYELDFSNKENLQAGAALINDLVTLVEEQDPFARANYGVEGIGEGVVMYPYEGPSNNRDDICRLLFKAKGAKHQAVKQKSPAQLDPEVVSSIKEFLGLMVTEARLEQGLVESCGGIAEMVKMGTFLKWMAVDVQKESVAELVAAGLTWKQVSKGVMTVSRVWLKARAESLSVE